MGDFTGDQHGAYTLHNTDYGVYVFVIDGCVSIAGETLNKRDAIGLSELDKLTFISKSSTTLLMIEVPMQKGDD